MIRNLLLLILVLTTITAQGQTIKGVVMDGGGKSVASAQLSVTNLSKNMVMWEWATDSLGRFTLPPIEIVDSLALTVFHSNYELYTQLLTPSTKELTVILTSADSIYNIEAVTVAGRVNPIRFEKGELVVSVEKMKNADRLSTAQLMNRIPGLYIDGDKVMLKNSPVEIYINGSKSTMPAAEVLKYIQSLPADAVQELRLIPMPSNRYGKAEAVVDIKLKSLAPDDLYSKTTVNGNMLGDRFGGGVEEFLMFKKKNITFTTRCSVLTNRSIILNDSKRIISHHRML